MYNTQLLYTSAAPIFRGNLYPYLVNAPETKVLSTPNNIIVDETKIEQSITPANLKLEIRNPYENNGFGPYWQVWGPQILSGPCLQKALENYRRTVQQAFTEEENNIVAALEAARVCMIENGSRLCKVGNVVLPDDLSNNQKSCNEGFLADDSCWSSCDGTLTTEQTNCLQNLQTRGAEIERIRVQKVKQAWQTWHNERAICFRRYFSPGVSTPFNPNYDSHY